MYFKLQKLTTVLRYFSSKNWKASTVNTLKVHRNLNTADQEMVPFDNSNLDWNDYFKNSGYGIKKYILKEQMDEKSINNAKLRYER